MPQNIYTEQVSLPGGNVQQSFRARDVFGDNSALIERMTLQGKKLAGLQYGFRSQGRGSPIWFDFPAEAAASARQQQNLQKCANADRTVNPDGSADHTTIEDAISAASDGEVICVQSGDYRPTTSTSSGTVAVVINKEVEVIGEPDPNGSNPARVDGEIHVTASNAAVRRMREENSDKFTSAPSVNPAGIKVNTGASSIENIEIEDNVVTSMEADLNGVSSSFSLNGIQVFGNSKVDKVTIRGNIVQNFLSQGDPNNFPEHGGIAGIKVQAFARRIIVEDNLITDLHSAGWAFGIVVKDSGSVTEIPQNVQVTSNRTEKVNDGSKFDVTDGGGTPFPGSSFAVESDSADTLFLRNNTLVSPNGVETKDGTSILDARQNWFGASSGPSSSPQNPNFTDASTGEEADGAGTWLLDRNGGGIQFDPWSTEDPNPPGESPTTGSNAAAVSAKVASITEERLFVDEVFLRASSALDVSVLLTRAQESAGSNAQAGFVAP